MPLKVVISAQGITEPVTCYGETIVINCHGALIYCSVPLPVGLKIQIHVIVTRTRTPAEVVYVDHERPQVCGIALGKPGNIWGLSFPPTDWYEDVHES